VGLETVWLSGEVDMPRSDDVDWVKRRKSMTLMNKTEGSSRGRLDGTVSRRIWRVFSVPRPCVV